MANFYCEYCGTKAASVSSLTASFCNRYPSGAGKGHHSLYQGTEKPQYTCKYCGTKTASISTLTAAFCNRHPNGTGKGHHSPAL